MGSFSWQKCFSVIPGAIALIARATLLQSRDSTYGAESYDSQTAVSTKTNSKSHKLSVTYVSAAL